MFNASDGQLVLSASDLTSHLSCPHLTQVRLGEVRGERARARRSSSPHAALVQERGLVHESAELARLSEQCGGHIDLTRDGDAKPPWPPSRAWLEAGHDATAAVMREGAPLLFQAQLFDGRWQGLADFLRRRDLAEARDEREHAAIARSTLGGYAYEVLDSKLAREVKPYVVHQLALYARLVATIQGVALPYAGVVLGDGTVADVQLDDFAALHRRVVRRFEAVIAAPTVADSYPEPVEHCGICSLEAACHEQWRADDHLSFVARASRVARGQLVGAGVPTLTALAESPAELEVAGLDADRLARLRRQAALQLDSRTSGEPRRHHLPPERAAGYALLPDPDPADLFFDLEGDPYVGVDGIEYLWGWSAIAGGVPLAEVAPVGDGPAGGGDYGCVWAHDEAEERAALEAFVDLVVARRAEHPGMRVYHYAPHEKSKLLGLSTKYGTRQAAVDRLVADGVLVDLYAVVSRGLQVGEESYSLKKLERHHAFVRKQKSVREGGGSIVAYEAWRAGVALVEAGDPGDEDPVLPPIDRARTLEDIRAYNEEDCRSTASLRDWLWGTLRAEAGAEYGVDWDALRRPEPAEEYAEPEYVGPLVELRERLHRGLPERPAPGAPPRPADPPVVAETPLEAERRLLGELLLYYRREEKPQWWEQYRLSELSPEELVEEREALGGLELVPGSEPVRATSRSLDYEMRFPVQEFKQPQGVSDPRDKSDPEADVPAVSIVSCDPAAGRLVLRRQAKFADAPLPRALVPSGLPPTRGLREALAELAEEVLAGGDRFSAVRRLVRREPPRLAGDLPLGDTTEALVAATLALDHSVLPVQGPPGTGKTYNAARMIVAALHRGLRVGITAQSHAAVRNVLAAVESYAAAEGLGPYSGFYKGDPDAYESATGWVVVADDNKLASRPVSGGDGARPAPGAGKPPQLVAGTAWLFSRSELREAFDLLFIDEAGQFSLANACAAGLGARSLVLLGDPQQLPQVTQGQHPDGAGASVLEHLLGGHPTVPDGRGVLLGTTWRMHPAITRWVSDASYEGRLRAVRDCAGRRIDSGGALGGAGIRLLEGEHQGRSQSSPEEAAAIGEACAALLGLRGQLPARVTEPVRDCPPELRPGAARDVGAADDGRRAVAVGAVGAAEGGLRAVAVGEGLVERPLRPQDILVVAPYNLAVQAIARAVPAGVRVGTVDKFQGQEASVVFFALTCSSADDVPRGLDFLFDPNRLNVAISRAQALAVLVHSPRLLDAECRTLEAMRRASGVCALVEAAGASGG